MKHCEMKGTWTQTSQISFTSWDPRNVYITVESHDYEIQEFYLELQLTVQLS